MNPRSHICYTCYPFEPKKGQTFNLLVRCYPFAILSSIGLERRATAGKSTEAHKPKMKKVAEPLQIKAKNRFCAAKREWW